MEREGFGPLNKLKCKKVISRTNMIWKSMPEVEEVKRGKGNAGEQSQDFISQT